ncbi:unnamed protein product [Brassica napus]|uniref:(rape) hypothetical protein n=1 Tax=Brassica napus TaxID=3708 RepID=A0A816Z623_BRANA|nr:unnamed protein product [Brassica napus]
MYKLYYNISQYIPMYKLRAWLWFGLLRRSCPSTDQHSLRVVVKWVYTVPVECNGGGNLWRKLLNDGIVGLRLFFVPSVVSFILPALGSWFDSSLWYGLSFRLEAVGTVAFRV